jgi:ABC-2 type transport system permease protein
MTVAVKSKDKTVMNSMAEFFSEIGTQLRHATTLTRKELQAYFGSPMALIFVGTFLVVTLFIFFWVETFFSRNIADVRPLFRWMPVLMAFLVAALTMRQWSEEQRGGTLEILLTLPVRRYSLVLGKFLSVMALVGVALALTLFLPITVAILGDLDWGPVFGGYLAALLMASAYVAIGLFVSSRTDNQIVALIATALLCGVFYLVGTQAVTGFVGDAIGEVLRALGTGSRFESIERGVIDLRDLVYYGSLTALFLLLNVLSLDSKRWSLGSHTAAYRRNAVLRVTLAGLNLLALNVWLYPIHRLRADLTAQNEYSLSPVTRDLIRNLQEPLTMRGYFSEKTHPLLAPLVPTIRDMMREYEVASGGKIKVEIVDPREDEEAEAEANSVYGIRPTPFRIAGRYEDTVINSYFDILILYGDQSVTLGFGDLIEVTPTASGAPDVRLRNLEYDLTRSIKKVVYGFQSLDAVLAHLEEPVRLTAFVTPGTLPEQLQEVPQMVEQVADELAESAGGNFVYQVVNPDTDASVTRESLYETYGIQPFAVSLFSTDTYYLHLLLEVGDETSVLYPGGEASEADLRAEIEAALKRAAPGFLKTVGIWTPSEDPVPDPFGQGMMQPISTWQQVRSFLSESYTLKTVDLSSGRVPGDVDVLVVVAPQGFTDTELFAIDQYLMRGGAVFLAAGNYVLSPQQFGGGIMMDAVEGGVADLLAHYGIGVGESFVMDPRNEPFPIQVQRQVGNMNVIELQQINYPFFVDVRQDSMSQASPIVANLPGITLQWVSPITVDETANQDRDVTVLMRSTEGAWLRTEPDVNPDMDSYPQYGFPVVGEQAAYPLAVSVGGTFESYFKDRPSPFEGGQESPEVVGPAAPGEATPPEQEETPVLGTIESSPESARLVVVGSAEFLDDATLGISQSLSRDRYLYNLQFVLNTVDWAVEDADLLSIRSRGTYARLLPDLTHEEQSFWEGLNYAVALIGLVALGVVWNSRRRGEEPIQLVERKTREPRRTQGSLGGSRFPPRRE